MRYFSKLFGIIACCVMGLSIISCDDGSNDLDELYKLWRDNNVTIIGTAKVGQKLAATSNGNGFIANSNFYWSYGVSKNSSIWYSDHSIKNNLSEANDSVLTITSDLLGKYIRLYRVLNYTDPKDPGMLFVADYRIGPVTN